MAKPSPNPIFPGASLLQPSMTVDIRGILPLPEDHWRRWEGCGSIHLQICKALTHLGSILTLSFLLLPNFPSALCPPPSSLLDGCLVPGNSFHTSDPFVFALRPFPPRAQTAPFLNGEGFSRQAYGAVTRSIPPLSHAAPWANHHLSGLVWTHRSRATILAIGSQSVLH